MLQTGHVRPIFRAGALLVQPCREGGRRLVVVIAAERDAGNLEGMRRLRKQGKAFHAVFLLGEAERFFRSRS